MKNYIFRNYTIEPLFETNNKFSGYGDVNIPDENYNDIIVFYQVNPASTPENQINEINEIKEKFSFILNNISNNRIIVFNLFENRRQNWQNKKPELINAIKDYNLFLEELSEENHSIKILDINAFYQSCKIDIIDWKFFFTSQIIVNPKLAKPFKEWYGKQLDALNLKRKKCIVLDCDNTLWGGVVGEEGTHGIKLGMDYPGICYLHFQKLLEMLSRKGIILAICSKNNLADVKEVWENNHNQIITDEILSAYKINWQDKASGIKSIAEDLNISTDSFVFIDDNPVERELVKEFLPEVEVPEFPDQPYDLVKFFWEIYQKYFSTYELTKEDLKKTEQYKQNAFRNKSKKSFNNLDDYLRNLNIEIDIMAANDSNIGRIAQMTQKTNQFNLTTKRYTEDDLRRFIANGSKIYCAEVRDKFGSNGISIACIIKENEEALLLDSYLLSCRILGREIENVTLLKIIEEIKDTNKEITAQYIPTKKNNMVSNFLDNIGFKLVDTDNDGIKSYIFDEMEKTDIKDHYK